MILTQQVRFENAQLMKVLPIVEDHLNAMTCPMDSYLEYRLTISEIYEIGLGEKLIGYAGFNDGVLSYFHVLLAYQAMAPEILKTLIVEKGVKRVYVNTNDPLFSALMAEWSYEKRLDSCWFVDGRATDQNRKVIEGAKMRLAQADDLDIIAQATDPFFDTLAQRISDQTVFMLEKDGELLGCGLIEKSELSTAWVSIGMVTCEAYRQQGVGQSVLWLVKDWVYKQGYRPIAGCAYHNALSRKTLEKAGMVVAGIGFEATLQFE